MVGTDSSFKVVDVAGVATAVDCVDECDRHQSCRGVDINETARPLISCTFYLGPDEFDAAESALAPGVAQFIAERCPEDGTSTILLHFKDLESRNATDDL